jgi:hypothetical protein
VITVYQCPQCEDEVTLEDTDFVDSHNLCIPCTYSESGLYQGAVYLVFQGYRENPVKLNKRAALTDLSKSGVLPAVR